MRKRLFFGFSCSREYTFSRKEEIKDTGIHISRERTKDLCDIPVESDPELECGIKKKGGTNVHMG